MTASRGGSRQDLKRKRRQQIRRRRTVAAAAVAVLVLVTALTFTDNSTDPPRGTPSRRARTSPHRGPATPEQLEHAAVRRLAEHQGFIVAGGSERRDIALTFDDGPGPYTWRMLKVIRRLHIAATFFEVGFMVHYFNDALRDELRLPYVVIGDHTETHPMIARLSEAKQRREIVGQTQQLAAYHAPFPDLYRPPYGSFNATTFRLLRRYHMLMVLWTVDTNDYQRPGVPEIVRAALSGARPGAIILMHDAGGDRTETIAALPRIVRLLRARGFRLVTVPQLVLDDPPQARQRLPAGLEGG